MIGAVNTDVLLELVWAAPLTVLCITVAWGMVVHGSARAIEASRAGRSAEAGKHAVVALVGAALFAAAIVFGLIIMTTKA